MGAAPQMNLFSHAEAAAAGVVCARCKVTEFKTSWQTFANNTCHVRMDCKACGTFIRYLPQNPDDGTPDFEHRPRPVDAHRGRTKPPPADWEWLGFIRQDDQAWRPVARASTLASCWHCSLTYPGDGDLLCIPRKPERWPATESETLEAASPGWVGWAREGQKQPWHPVAEGRTEDEAWTKTLELPGDLLVLPRARTPEKRRENKRGQVR